MRSSVVSHACSLGFKMKQYFQIPAAMILLVAAILKAHQLATTPLVENLVFQSRSIETLLVIVEILLGCWLIANW